MYKSLKYSPYQPNSCSQDEPLSEQTYSSTKQKYVNSNHFLEYKILAHHLNSKIVTEDIVSLPALPHHPNHPIPFNSEK